jgi:FAD/FMN-containing dehydrogenase
VPQGGRTGISGGAVSHAGEIILSLERLNAIESLDPISRTAVLQAGVTLGALMQACQPHHLSPAIDLGARDSATLGGLASTNAGGSQAFRFGTMRDRLLGLEVVLADGTVITELGQVRKRNEGLALEQLFIGAEGILGVITRVSIALVDEDGPLAAALIAVPSLSAAVTLTDQLQRATDLRLSAMELMSGNHAHISSHALGFTEFSQLCAQPYVVLIEVTAPNAGAAEESLVHALAGPLESGLIVDAVIAQNEQQRRAMWQVREDWSVDRQRPGGLWYDVSVPIAHLARYLERFTSELTQHDPGLSIFVVGHLADGNIHITVNAAQPISARYEEIAALVTATLRDIGG